MNIDQNKTYITPTNKSNFLAHENLDNISTLLRTLKKEVQKNSSFVGDEFVSQVRSMKEGKIKEKPDFEYCFNLNA